MRETLKEELEKRGFADGELKGDMHVHMESQMDSGATIDDFLKRYSEMKTEKVAITDHGVITAYPDVLDKAGSYGIEIVPGCELYLKDKIGRRMHLIVIAPTLEKYHDLCKICTESFRDVETVGTVNIPYSNHELLEKYAKGMIGTSACMQGPLSMVIRQNNDIEEKIHKLEGKISAGAEKKKEELEEKVASLEKERDDAREEKTRRRKEKAGQDELDKIGEKVTELSSMISKAKKELKKVSETAAKNTEIQKSVEELRSHILPEDEIKQEILNTFREYEKFFGKGNFYVELQNHEIDLEKQIMKILAEVAKENNLPVVATNDTHMALESDAIKRQIMRSNRFGRWDEPMQGDGELYIKSSMELAEMISRIADDETVIEAVENSWKILDRCHVELPKENHYPKFHVPDGTTAEEYLRKLAYKGVEGRTPQEDLTEEEIKRLEYELSIICKMGYADYHLIVQDFLNFGRKLGHMPEERLDYLKEHMESMTLKAMVEYVEEDQSEVGYYIGPGRGSAAGSDVCYRIGITNIDPIKNGLLFERFLNPERVSMPDIDSDIETFARPVLVEYVKKKYGYDAVCSIMTKAYAGGKSSIRTYGRVKESIKEDRTYFDKADLVCKAFPKDQKAKIADCREMLEEEFSGDETAMDIIENAAKIEGLFTNYSAHAAGIIITDGKPVSDYVALMYDKENRIWKTQCDMNYAEAMGLLKFDFLGLRTLSVISETLIRIRKRYGTVIDIENLPQEPEVYKNIYASGKTNAVFQVESSGMKEMLRKFKPETFEDLTLLIAAYRPGPMEFIPGIIRSKQFGEKPDYVIRDMGRVLDVTYGYPIYQEQLMEIFHGFAGFSLGEADIVRRYMSKKKVEKFMAFEDKFIDGLVANGADRSKAKKFWESLVDFSKYAFNKSHAACYATVSYQTAWLKYHYPAEFVTSMLNTYDADGIKKKAPALLGEVKNIRLLPPDINLSEKMFEMDKEGGIVFGLSNIKGAGKQTESIAKGKPFHSFADYMSRGHVNKKITNALIFAGAFDRLCSNRKALFAAYEEFDAVLGKVKEKKKKIQELEQKIEIVRKSDTPLSDLVNAGFKLKRAPKESDLMEKLATAEEELRAAQAAIGDIMIRTDIPEDKRDRLDAEKNILGMYVSANPLDDYADPAEKGCRCISDVESGQTAVMGLVSNVRIVNRKSDGKPFAFFDIEDKTGKMEAVLFTKKYPIFKDILKDGAVLRFEGQARKQDNGSGPNGEEEDTEEIYQLTCNEIEILSPSMPPIIIHVKNLFQWTEFCGEIQKYCSKEGHPLEVDNMAEDQLRKTDLLVSDTILQDRRFHTVMTE